MTSLKEFRVAINKVLAEQAGLKVRRASVPTRYWAECFDNIKRFGFEPQTIIDIGVLGGTQELYDAFPGAKLYLFEPNPECEPALKRIAEQYGAKYWLTAAGPQPGTMDFWVRPADPGASSMSDVGGNSSRISVPVVRVDQVLKSDDIKQPAILKIDVEGFELDVIAGCTGLLDQIEMVILETRFFRYHERMAEFAEVVASMRDLGYVVYDVLDGAYRPRDGVLDFVDLVFVRHNGFLRSRISIQYD